MGMGTHIPQYASSIQTHQQHGPSQWTAQEYKCQYVKLPLGHKRYQWAANAFVFPSSALQTSTHPVSALGSPKLNVPPRMCQTKYPAISVRFHLTLSACKQTFPLNMMIWLADKSSVCFNPFWATIWQNFKECLGTDDCLYYSQCVSFLQLCVVSYYTPVSPQWHHWLKKKNKTIEKRTTAW